MPKLPPPFLIFFALLFSFANSACTTGYFTDTSPCDTQATLVECKEYTSVSIGASQWHYFYIPLDGIEGNIEFDFIVDGPSYHAYFNFQSGDSENLPNDVTYDYKLDIAGEGQTIPSGSLMSGMANKDEGVMVFGIKNPYYTTSPFEVRYFTKTGDCRHPVNPLAIIIGSAVILFIALVILLICLFRKNRQRNAAAIQDERRHHVEPEVQIILLEPPQPIQKDNKTSDFLTLEDLQKFFPKKPFKEFENPFQQSGCSVCLEDFTTEVSCHQLYCNHIFHEACVEKWLEKHNSCPGCRVPIGKKAIEGFLEKQRKVKKDKVFNTLEIQIQNREYGK